MSILSCLDCITPPGWLLTIIFEIIIVYYLIRLLKSIYNVFLRPKTDFPKRYGENSYALVTGATDGIGKGYAIALAKRGINLILVSRTKSKLQQVKEEIIKEYPSIKIEIIVYDFSTKITLKDYEEAFGKLQNEFDISILINNVGISHEDYTKVLEDNQMMIDYLNVNCLSQMLITKLLMDKMSKRKSKSAILSMSSLAGDIPYPGNAIYSATKSFNDFFTRGLFGEYGYEKGNIDFLSMKPSYVQSNMSQMQADGWDCCSVQQHCEACLNDLGHTIETFGYVTHKIQGNILRLFPEFIKRMMFADSKAKEEKLQARHQNKKKQ